MNASFLYERPIEGEKGLFSGGMCTEELQFSYLSD